VVIYDYLVNPSILSHAAETAELVSLGRAGVGREATQTEINARLVTEARAGKTVVRLKGGDPSVFGRGANEVAALRQAQVPYEIVAALKCSRSSFSMLSINGRYDGDVVSVQLRLEAHDLGHGLGCVPAHAAGFLADEPEQPSQLFSNEVGIMLGDA
jgi:precorrin-4 methylase